MKKKRKNILLIAGMLLALLVGILVYTDYTQEQIYQESTANLLSTYGQSAKTFTMFAQRNWNILTDWDSYLGTLAELGQQEEQWQEYIAQKATWQYTDFFLFNEQCEFWTTAGRQGTAEHMKENFAEQGVKVEAIEVTVQTHQFEQNLEQGRGNNSNTANETGAGRKRTRRINLNAAFAEEEPQTEEDRIAADMMSANGNTVDFTA